VNHFTVPQLLPLIEHMKVTSWNLYLCNLFLCHTLSTSNCQSTNVSTYTAEKSGLLRAALDVIFNAIVISVVTYALPPFAEQLSKADKGRLDKLCCKALRRGFVAKHSPLTTSYRPEIKNYFIE